MPADSNQVKKIVRSLLISAKHGLTINQLCAEYTAVTYKNMPYKELGYNTAIDMVKNMPDVVSPVFISGGVMILKGVPDSSTAHIHELVQHQKTTGRNKNIVKTPRVKSTTKVVPDFIRCRISNVMKRYPCGCDVRSFEAAYYHSYRRNLNARSFGMFTIREVFEACPDLISIAKRGPFTFVYPVMKTFGDLGEISRMKTKGESHSLFYSKSSSISEVTKKEVYAVLSKMENGIWAVRFPIEYKNMYKRELNYQQMGFGSIVEFMHKLLDIVTITRPCGTGDWFLSPRHLKREVVNKAYERPELAVLPNATYTEHEPGQVDDIIEIFLSYIINPSDIWFQCVDQLGRLNDLMEEMSSFYEESKHSEDFKYFEHHLKTDKVCCAKYVDGEWYRAVIKNILSPKEIQVFYVDYGNELCVDINCLRLLKNNFLHFPSQAIRSELDGVKPTNDESWSKEAVDRFYDLSQNKNLFGRVVSKGHMVSVEIVDTTTENDVYFADVLLDAKLAIESKELHAIDGNLDKANALKRLENIENSSYEIEEEKNEVKLKRVEMSEMSFHVIHYRNRAWLTSAEISSLFWEGDILRQMLTRRKLVFPNEIISLEENKDLLSAMKKYDVIGLSELRSVVTIYPFNCLPQLCDAFKAKLSCCRDVIKDYISKLNADETEFWREGHNEEATKEEKLKLEQLALKFKKKRLLHCIMTNCAPSHKTIGEIRELEKQIKLREKELNS